MLNKACLGPWRQSAPGKPFGLFLALVFLLCLNIACRDGGGGRAPLAALTVSTGTLVPPFTPGVTDYELTSLNSINTIHVTATSVDSGAYDITVNGQAALSGSPVPMHLSAGEDIQVVLTARDGTNTSSFYRVRYLSSTLPKFTIRKDLTQTIDDSYVMANARNCIFITDRAGNIRYYRDCGSLAFDFKRFDVGGSAFYSYCSQDPGIVSVPNTVTGSVHLMDDQFQDIRTIRFLAHGAHGEYPIDVHEFHLYSPTHWLVVAYVVKTLDLSGLDASWGDSARVNACLIQEVQDGAVIFEWDSTDYPQLYSDSVEGNSFANGVASDYAHLNSVNIDPGDNNLIVSLRHTNSVIKIDRNTGHILWNLGGRSDDFGLTADQLFSHQHHATILGTGELLLFDNGNPAGPTRVLAFTLKEGTAKSVTAFNEVCRKPSGWMYSSFMGSALMLGPGRCLVGWGGTPGDGLADPDVSEMLNGTPVWSLSFEDPNTFSYRAFLIPSSAF